MPYIAGGPIPVYITGSDLIPASYPEVLNYDALPPAADHNTEMYVCLTAKGVYFFGRKPAGYYYSNGVEWSYIGDLAEPYFNDSILTFFDDVDPTKRLKFQVSSIASTTVRTATWPDKDGTVAMIADVNAITPNATHTGDASGATSLTVTGINGVTLSGLATGLVKNTTGTGIPSIATGADLPAMTATVGGAVPTPPNNTTTFLRGDGTFAAPETGSMATLSTTVDMGNESNYEEVTLTDASIHTTSKLIPLIAEAEEAILQAMTVTVKSISEGSAILSIGTPNGASGIFNLNIYIS